MKLSTLLESLRADVLGLQQQLVDELADEFDVSLKGRHGQAGLADERETYSIQVRHPLLKMPITISVFADGPNGAEVKVGSYIQFDISHPGGLGTLLEHINGKVDAVKIHQWLLANGFVETDKTKFETQERLRLLGSGFIKSSKLFVKKLEYSTLAFKLGFDSYQNVQHEWWDINNGSTANSVTSHRIGTFASVEHLLGSLIKHPDK